MPNSLRDSRSDHYLPKRDKSTRLLYKRSSGGLLIVAARARRRTRQKKIYQKVPFFWCCPVACPMNEESLRSFFWSVDPLGTLTSLALQRILLGDKVAEA